MNVGNIREVRPGVWSVSVRRGSGTHYETVHGQKADAERACILAAAELERNYTTTLEDVWPDFIRHCECKGLTIATVNYYLNAYRLYIAPRFGETPLENIKTRDVQRWLIGMTAPQAHKAVRVMRRVFRYAAAMGYCNGTPFDYARMEYPKAAKKRPRLWGVTQVLYACEQLQGTPIEALWLTMVGGGLRLEEALALRWCDVERASDGSAVVRVEKAWTEADGLKETKTPYSERLVVICEPFGSRLLDIRRRKGDVYPLSKENCSRREWRKLWMKPAQLSETRGLLRELPYLPISKMRAVHETMAQAAGVADTLNARVHGRTNIGTGYRHYLEPGDVALSDAAKLMGEYIAHKTNEQ